MARWTGFVLAALLVAAFVASRFWSATVLVYPHYKVSAGQGGLALLSLPAWDPQWSVFTQFNFAELPRSSQFFFWFHILRPNEGCLIPLWFLALLAAVPTALLWCIDCRRLGPERCTTCSYDMTGVDGRVCPECGAMSAAGIDRANS